jgi:hypothetical protein
LASSPAPQTATTLHSTETTSPHSPTTTTTLLPAVLASASENPTFSGWLEAPTSQSASYPLSLARPSLATLHFSGASSLTLSYSCTTASNTITGTSGLTLAVPSGSCTIEVSGSDTVPATTFTLALS